MDWKNNINDNIDNSTNATSNNINIYISDWTNDGIKVKDNDSIDPDPPSPCGNYLVPTYIQKVLEQRGFK